MSETTKDETSTHPPAAKCQPSYSPLQEGCFRLLRISKASDANIVIELKQFPIKESPEYFALSYVCGNGELDHTIDVDGSRLSVTQNLFASILAIDSFLEQCNLRNAWIWIDAVCIDQANLEEKAKQVLLMDRVYRGARLVLIWFGELSGYDLTSYQILEWCCVYGAAKLHHAEQRNEPSMRSDAQRQSDECLERLLPKANISRSSLEALFQAVDILSRTNELETTTEDFDAFLLSSAGKHLFGREDQVWLRLLTFLSHPWFSRIWTIQEIRLAKSAYLITQQSHVLWDFIIWFRGVLCASPHACKLFSNEISLQARPGLYNAALTDVHKPSPITQMDPLWCDDFELHGLLEGIRGGKASVRKDYIYGLLGLVSDRIRSEITVDYQDSVSTEQVFSQAVAAAYRANNGWTSLMATYAGISKELSGLPSWVPDFSSSSLGEYDLGRTPPNLSSDVCDRYKHLSRICFSDDHRIATVRGIRTDCVDSAISKPRMFKDEDAQRLEAHCELLESACDLQEDDFDLLFGQDLYAWFREMDSVFPQDNSDADVVPAWICKFLVKEDVDSITKVYHSLRQFVNLVHDHGIKTVAEARAVADSYSDNEELENCVEAALALSLCTKGVYIFRTRAGRLGFAPNSVQPDDLVCFIPGRGIYLDAISADRKRYVTAKVSVDGFMGDNLLDALPLGESEWEDFHLH